MKQFTTKAVDTRFLYKDPHGSLRMPVYDSASFEFESAEEQELAFLGRNPHHMYSRISNPTVAHLEFMIKNLTRSQGVVAMASGMAAISSLIVFIAGSGDSIVTTKALFGNTYSLFETTLKRWGLQVQYFDPTHTEDIGKLIDAKTRAIFVESITNPQLQVADIQTLGKIALQHNIPLIIDATLTPLRFYNPREYGVAVEIVSSTKLISGGATSVGGLLIDYGVYDWKKNPRLVEDAEQVGSFALLKRLRSESYRNLGACLSPHNAYLQSLGLETLELRLLRASETTLKIAQYLNTDTRVMSVNYPGLKGLLGYKIIQEQYDGNAGLVLTFDLQSKEQCYKFINCLKLIRRATNLHDNRTLVLHPASTIFCEYTTEEKNNMIYENQ